VTRFGDFELDQEQRQLLHSGRPVPFEPKAYELLRLLIERRPRALSRAQIRDVVWPDTLISESTLGVIVNSIRKALGDDAQEPRFIRTVHGFGYAFCGEAHETGAVGGQRVSELRADLKQLKRDSGSAREAMPSEKAAVAACGGEGCGWALFSSG
jgi:DNA-binding winged helix-turn-helix (wHTH) protein